MKYYAERRGNKRGRLRAEYAEGISGGISNKQIRRLVNVFCGRHFEKCDIDHIKRAR